MGVYSISDPLCAILAMMSVCYRPPPFCDEMSLFCVVCNSSPKGGNLSVSRFQHRAC